MGSAAEAEAAWKTPGCGRSSIGSGIPWCPLQVTSGGSMSCINEQEKTREIVLNIDFIINIILNVQSK